MIEINTGIDETAPFNIFMELISDASGNFPDIIHWGAPPVRNGRPLPKMSAQYRLPLLMVPLVGS